MDTFLLFAFVVAVAVVIDVKTARSGEPVWVAIAFGAVSLGLTMCRTDGPACRGPRKPPESSGFDSNRRVIWGIPVQMSTYEVTSKGKK
jgi:hypothetical protein